MRYIQIMLFTFLFLLQTSFAQDCPPGEVLLTQTLRSDNLIDLSELPDGLYLLEIKTENTIWVDRVLKVQ